jgi:hypothetical protein
MESVCSLNQCRIGVTSKNEVEFNKLSSIKMRNYNYYGSYQTIINIQQRENETLQGIKFTLNLGIASKRDRMN